jgi:parallel beta-helix repeat protein
VKKILLTAVFIFVILLGAMADTQSVHLASAQNTYVMINEEGCIVPSTAPIQRDGNLYTLIGDVEEITIERSDITLDGNGHTVSQPFVAEGVILHSVKNVTVKNLIVKGGMYGIFLRQASNITLSNNTVTETSVPFPQNMGTCGICVSGGGNNVIVGNRLENNLHGIDLVDTVEGNTIRENNIIGNSEGMRFRNSSGNIIYNNNFVNNKFKSSTSMPCQRRQ